MSSKADSLRITEIFYSLQGEARNVGLPTVFIRLTGCPLRCQYCDTAYAFTGGEAMLLDEIMAQVANYNTQHVTVTGGEPLAQKNCLTLLQRLCDAGYEVSLETSGALDISEVDSRVSRVMDLKTPGSGELERNRYQNIELLQANDQLKFVICNQQDYIWSKQILDEYQIHARCEVLFSPCHGDLEAVTLAGWILNDQLSVRMQVQLHKYLWGNEAGR